MSTTPAPLAQLIRALRTDGMENPLAAIDRAQRVADMMAECESDGMTPPESLSAEASAIADLQPALWGHVCAGYVGGGATLREIASRQSSSLALSLRTC